MSLVGQVLWKRSVMGCAGAGDAAGAGAALSLGVGAAFLSPRSSRAQPAATAATPAAPTAAFVRKPRRVVMLGFFMMLSFRQGQDR
jgi:hypothetical protein